MTARIPFSDRARLSAPPYLSRQKIHAQIWRWIEGSTGGTALVLHGQQKRAGVTRTLEEFILELKQVQLKGIDEVAFSIIDLASQGHLSAPELLVEARNMFITRVGALTSLKLKPIDRHFLAFDAIWLLWAAAEFHNDAPPKELVLSTAARAVKTSVALSFKLVTLGSLDALVSLFKGFDAAANLSGIGKDIAQVGLEAQKDGWTEKVARQLSHLVVTAIGPRLSPFARKLLASKRPQPEDLEMLMPELFAEAVSSTLRGLSKNDRCVLIVDAADEIEEEFLETVTVRQALCEALGGVSSSQALLVLGARNSTPWPTELNSKFKVEGIGLPDVCQAEVEFGWKERLTAVELNQVVQEVLCDGRNAAPAGDFAAAYKRAKSLKEANAIR